MMRKGPKSPAIARAIRTPAAPRSRMLLSAAVAIGLFSLPVASVLANDSHATNRSVGQKWIGNTGTPVVADELPETVPEAVDFIRDTLERQGFDIELTVDHAAAAASVGLNLPPTQVVFFGNKRTDTALIKRSQTVALDLPLRFLVWEDDIGNVRVNTNDMGFLMDRHELPTFDLRLHIVSNVLTQFGDTDNGIQLVESEQSFDDTVAALLETLEARGFRIPLVADYAERAEEIGKPLRPTTLVMFGNPNVGTPLMQNSRSIGLDLPQKMLVYQDKRGHIRLAYNDPFYLASKHDVIGEETRLGNIANALRNIAETAAGVAP